MREEILNAALAGFTESGYSATTIDHIRRRCGATTGSIYHFFDNKEHIAASLYVDILRDYQGELIAALERRRLARTGVRSIVASHLQWVETNPASARYLQRLGEAEFMVRARTQIAELNREFFGRVFAWFGPHIAENRIRRFPRLLYAPLIVGAAQEYARRWLADGRIPPPTRVSPALAAAAWRAVGIQESRHEATV